MPNIILLGSPGSGKGTQADRLKNKYDLHHLSTGALFRQHIKDNSPIGQKVKAFLDKGAFVPDTITNDMVHDYLDHYSNVLFDGFPRTVPQAEVLHDMCAQFEEDIDVVISIDVPDEEVVKRIILRGKDSGRSDDNEQTAKARLQEYHEKTQPLLTYYENEHKLIRINGFQDIDAVTDEIIAKLDAALPQQS